MIIKTHQSLFGFRSRPVKHCWSRPLQNNTKCQERDGVTELQTERETAVTGFIIHGIETERWSNG